MERLKDLGEMFHRFLVFRTVLSQIISRREIQENHTWILQN